jgi:hypothetical protein
VLTVADGGWQEIEAMAREGGARGTIYEILREEELL